MIMILICIDAVMVCIVAGLLMELFQLRKQLEEQKIICANLKTWQPKWKQQTEKQVEKPVEKPAESPREMLARAWESVRGTKDWADMGAVGFWLQYHDCEQPHRKYGFSRLSDWAESLDEWRVVRDPEQYGGTPAVLMKR